MKQRTETLHISLFYGKFSVRALLFPVVDLCAASHEMTAFFIGWVDGWGWGGGWRLDDLLDNQKPPLLLGFVSSG